MKRTFSLLGALVVLLGVAGCATVNNTGHTSAPTSARPLLETPPATEAEARAKSHTELGMAYFEVGRFAVALDEARIALAHYPDYPLAHHLMGLSYMFIEDMAAARENFLRALRRAPDDPDFNNSYGWFLCVVGEEREGLERLAVAARNPYYRHASRPYTNAGLCYLRLNDDEAAMEQFRRAAALDPSNQVALYNMAEIAYRRGDYAAASTQLVRLHQQEDPSAASVWLGLRTARKLGNRDVEASYAAQLRGRFSDSGEYQSMTQGNYE